MSKCQFCKRKISLSTYQQCKYCNMSLCISCIQLEIHNCTNINDSIQVSKNNILKSLTKNSNLDMKYIDYDHGNAY